jgi:hypothetical protein
MNFQIQQNKLQYELKKEFMKVLAGKLLNLQELMGLMRMQ